MVKKAKNTLKLSPKEYGQSGVTKLTLKHNGDLKKDNDSLKKSLKISQDAFENLRLESNNLEKRNAVIEDRLKFSIVPEILKILLSFGGGYFTNLVTSDYVKPIHWIGFVLCIIIVIGIVIFQFFRNK